MLKRGGIISLTDWAKICAILACMLVILCAIYFLYVKQLPTTEKLSKVSFYGEFSTDGVNYQNVKDATSDDFPYKASAIIKGRFATAIPEGEFVFFSVNNYYVIIRINGDYVMNHGYPGESGVSYQGFYSPGITIDDEVTIYLNENVPSSSRSIVKDFLDSARYGSKTALYFYAMLAYLPALATSSCMICVAIFMFFTSSALSGGEGNFNISLKYFCFFMIMAGIEFCTDYHFLNLLYYCPACGQ